MSAEWASVTMTTLPRFASGATNYPPRPATQRPEILPGIAGLIGSCTNGPNNYLEKSYERKMPLQR